MGVIECAVGKKERLDIVQNGYENWWSVESSPNATRADGIVLELVQQLL